MSRTNKGKRHPTYEYWSKRPFSRQHGAAPGKVTKKLTHSKERAEAKQELLKQPPEPDDDEEET